MSAAVGIAAEAADNAAEAAVADNIAAADSAAVVQHNIPADCCYHTFCCSGCGLVGTEELAVLVLRQDQ